MTFNKPTPWRLICKILPGWSGGTFSYLYLSAECGNGKEINLLEIDIIRRYIPRTAKIEKDYVYAKVSTINKTIQNLLWDWNTITLELEKKDE